MRQHAWKLRRAGGWAMVGSVLAAGALMPAIQARAAEKKPNILVVFGDDIGQANISVFTKGLMGYHTPNIDRIANEGMLFTDYYAEQTAGRSSFITGQCVFRTGLSKVGLPAAPVGIHKADPTIAELIKPLGYATGQFGKNHLGDRNEYLPTVHGFDEFFGNLYHLNAEEEPELFNYPQDPQFRQMFGPRGVLRCKATEKDDSTVDPRFGKVGRQTIEDTGPLTRKRMETIDDETAAAAIDFMTRQVKAGKPFFCWYNATRMHCRTHVRPEHRSPRGASALTEYADGMIEHDGTVGSLLEALDELGITDNTIVVYTTDNGPHANTWPDAATTPFRSEKNSNWEGAFRVPCFIRWPEHITPGSVSNEIVSGLDWMPTLLAAAGDPDVKEELLKGYTLGDMTYKVHLDGYNLLPYLTGEEAGSPRREFFYFSDDGDLLNLRFLLQRGGCRSFHIAAKDAVPPGKHTVVCDFTYDGGGFGRGGTGILGVDGKQVARGRIDRTIAVRFSFDETFDVGEDTGTAVNDDYDVPCAFTGEIEKVVVKLGETGEKARQHAEARSRADE